MSKFWAHAFRSLCDRILMLPCVGASTSFMRSCRTRVSKNRAADPLDSPRSCVKAAAASLYRFRFWPFVSAESAEAMAD